MEHSTFQGVVPVIESERFRVEVDIWLETTAAGALHYTCRECRALDRLSPESPWRPYGRMDGFGSAIDKSRLAAAIAPLLDVAPISEDPKGLVLAIIMLRTRLNFSRHQLGEAIGKTAAVVYTIENGSLRMVTEDMLSKFSKLALDLGYPRLASYFMTGGKQALSFARHAQRKGETERW